MSNSTEGIEYERLDQYDYAYNDDFEIEDIEEKFALLIGSFIIHFNSLENQLNVCIAEIIHEGTHEFGYQIVEKLLMKNKIDLFHKLYLRFVSMVNVKHKDHLKQLKKQLEEINTFRNTIVHGNWALYNKKGYLRSKIITDTEEGEVRFKLTKIYKKDIKLKIKEIIYLEEELYELYAKYYEGAF